MSIRQHLANGRAFGVGAGILLVLAAGVYAVRSGFGGEEREPTPAAFYSIDDGKTYFSEATLKVSPFDRDGKEAVRAHVYECPGGKHRFLGSLERLSPEGAAEVQKSKKAGTVPDSPAQMRLAEQIQMKRPGEAKWLPRLDFVGQFVPKCPDGHPGPATLVVP